MADSVRDQILAAITTALGAAGGPTNLTVDRFRLTALEKDVLPSIIVYPIEEAVQRPDLDAAVGRVMTIGLECRVAGASSNPVDHALDELLAWNTAVMLADRKWGGLAEDTREKRIRWEGAAAESEFGYALQEFDVEYFTVEGDQTTVAS